MTLRERLALPDVAGLPDWQAAERLTAPDQSLPEIVELVPTPIGPTAVMGAIGVAQGAAVLDRLQSLTASSSVVRWGLLGLTSPRGLDIGEPAVREQIDALVPAVMTAAQAAAIKALAERRRHPSWAEHAGVEVTARTVGLARGGV